MSATFSPEPVLAFLPGKLQSIHCLRTDLTTKNHPLIKTYPPLEEKINIWSHVTGLVLSVVGMVALLIKAGQADNPTQWAAVLIFGLSMICLYAASSLYHSATEPRIRIRRRVYDHASIYVLIAGTYTPLALIALEPAVGKPLFFIAWAVALTGIILKLFFTGRFDKLSTLMYVAMGWMVLFVLQDFIDALSPEGLFWLAAGGVSYTVGAVAYSIKRIPFHHAIFHLFVVLGSLCHFICIYSFVL